MPTADAITTISTSVSATAASATGRATIGANVATGADSFGAVLDRAGVALSQRDVLETDAVAGAIAENVVNDASLAFAGVAAFPLALLQTIPGLLPAAVNLSQTADEAASAALPEIEADPTDEAAATTTASQFVDPFAFFRNGTLSVTTNPASTNPVTTNPSPGNSREDFQTPASGTSPGTDSFPSVVPQAEGAEVRGIPAAVADASSPHPRRLPTVPPQVPIVTGLNPSTIPPELAPTEPGANPVAAIANVSGPRPVAPVDIRTTFPDRLAALANQGEVAAATVASLNRPAAGNFATDFRVLIGQVALSGGSNFTADSTDFAQSVVGSEPSRSPVELPDNSTTPGTGAFATATLPVAPQVSEVPGTPAPTPPAGSSPLSPAVQLSEAIAVHARPLHANESVEFRMRLNPPELGRLDIHLKSSGDRIDGHLIVANEAIRGMIESQLPELRQRLEAAGVTVHNLDVSTGSNSGQQQNPDGRPSPFFQFDDPAAPILPRTRIRSGVPSGSGRLDVTA